VVELPCESIDERVDGGEAAVFLSERGKLGCKQTTARRGVNQSRCSSTTATVVIVNVDISSVKIASLASQQIPAAHLRGTVRIVAHEEVVKVPPEGCCVVSRVPDEQQSGVVGDGRKCVSAVGDCSDRVIRAAARDRR
jgi:hypothetical protein